MEEPPTLPKQRVLRSWSGGPKAAIAIGQGEYGRQLREGAGVVAYPTEAPPQAFELMSPHALRMLASSRDDVRT